jgi:hypothetical protein
MLGSSAENQLTPGKYDAIQFKTLRDITANPVRGKPYAADQRML